MQTAAIKLISRLGIQPPPPHQLSHHHAHINTDTHTHTRSVNGGFSSSERDELGSGKLYLPSPHPVSDSDLNPLGEEGKKHNAAPTTHRVHVSHHCFAACLVSLSLCPSFPCLVILGTTSAPLSLSLAVSGLFVSITCWLSFVRSLCLLCTLCLRLYIYLILLSLWLSLSSLYSSASLCRPLSMEDGFLLYGFNEGIHQGVRGS